MTKYKFTQFLSTWLYILFLILYSSCEGEEKELGSHFYVLTEKVYSRGPVISKVSINGEVNELYEFEGFEVDGFIASNIYYSLYRGTESASVINAIDINTGDLIKSEEYMYLSNHCCNEYLFEKINDKFITIGYYMGSNNMEQILRIVDPETLYIEDSLIIESHHSILDVKHVGNKVFIANQNTLFVYDANTWERIEIVELNDILLVQIAPDNKGNMLLQAYDRLGILNLNTMKIENITR